MTSLLLLSKKRRFNKIFISSVHLCNFQFELFLHPKQMDTDKSGKSIFFKGKAQDEARWSVEAEGPEPWEEALP